MAIQIQGKLVDFTAVHGSGSSEWVPSAGGVTQAEVAAMIQAAVAALPQTRIYQNGQWHTGVTDIYVGPQGSEPADLAADAIKLYYETP